MSEDLQFEEPDSWDLVLKPEKSPFSLDLKTIWRYRDLLSMFVKRDVVTLYKQTILGPVWYVLQPLLTTAIYVFVFGRVAGLSTDGLPMILFYLSGITIWNFFSEAFTTTSKTFMENATMFGKVYFPRIIVPVSKVTSALIKFCIQFVMFILVLLLYIMFRELPVHISWTIFLLPVYLLVMSMLGLGFGIIFTSLTVRYRDLNFLLTFGVQLLMFLSPVIYPLSSLPEKFQWIIALNPITPVIEGFRFILLGSGMFSLPQFMYSVAFAIAVFTLGVFVFNKTERNFIDTV